MTVGDKVWYLHRDSSGMTRQTEAVVLQVRARPASGVWARIKRDFRRPAWVRIKNLRPKD